MKHRVLILGAGRMGYAIAKDLAVDPRLALSILDADPAALERVRPYAAELLLVESSPPTAQLAAKSDLVVGALPSRLGFSALRDVLGAGRPYADISFMPEDPLALDALAKEKGVAAVVDCGLAPGLPNLAMGRLQSRWHRLTEMRYCVGGLPFVRRWPYDYVAPFAPSDVIEEYTRPARLKRGGRIVTRPALSDPEFVEVPGVGTLEAFNTDGLRTLLATVDCPDMTEKTLRYPGHRALMEVLRETGFFSEERVDLGGAGVSPLALTARLLFPHWRARKGERSWTFLKLDAAGRDADAGDENRSYALEVYDEDEAEGGLTSMARTTAFPCAIVARLLLEGRIAQRGVLPPESIGREPGIADTVFAELRARGVSIKETWR